MKQTVALFLDAYRDLNARKLFWVTLGISIAGVLLLAMVGVEADAITLFRWRWEREDAAFFYRLQILSKIAIGIWLSWGAVILALISTGGIFPDLIVSGAIDLYLSKPISRLRLFLTKYVAGLMFVALQLAIFCAGCFLVVGMRTHEWRPSLFLAIPLVTLRFSYVYGFCVLLGVWTRSTVAALLLAIILLVIFSGAAFVDNAVTTFHRGLDLTISRAQADIRWIDTQLKSSKKIVHQSLLQSLLQSGKDLVDFDRGLLGKRRDEDVNRIAIATSKLVRVQTIHQVASGLHTILPKTEETKNLLERHLIRDDEISSEPRQLGGAPPPVMGVNMKELAAAGYEVQTAARHESRLYIIGSSLLCEAVVVMLAAWIFCRRDY